MFGDLCGGVEVGLGPGGGGGGLEQDAIIAESMVERSDVSAWSVNTPSASRSSSLVVVESICNISKVDKNRNYWVVSTFGFDFFISDKGVFLGSRLVDGVVCLISF
jgi:hypothetical protein